MIFRWGFGSASIMRFRMAQKYFKTGIFIALMALHCFLLFVMTNKGWYKFQNQGFRWNSKENVATKSLNRDGASSSSETIGPGLGAPPPKLKCDTGPKKKAVVIIAQMRSGSSFLGEFFNQHSEIYYLFEPLRGINHRRDDWQDLQRIVLNDVFKCDYSRIVEIYKNSTEDKWVKCRSNVCFADRSKFLWRNTELCVMKEPVCGVPMFDKDVLETVCKQSLFTAVKAVRLPSLAELEHFLTDPELDLKVIQLVRDPRAVVPSQISMMQETFKKLSLYASMLCQHYAKNYRYVQNCILASANSSKKAYSCDETVHDLWQGRFLRISHEYISERPFDALKLLYSFVGLNFDKAVADWLAKSTGAAYRQAGSVQQSNAISSEGFYGTVRNSKAVLNAWRLKQSFATVATIQKSCVTVMGDLGYVSVWNETTLLNTSNQLYDLQKALFTTS